MNEERLKCFVCGKEIEDEEKSLFFCSNDCRRKCIPKENSYSEYSDSMYEIHNYHIRTGEYNLCYNGQLFWSAIGMCEMFNEKIDGFYYWAVRVMRSDNKCLN